MGKYWALSIQPNVWFEFSATSSSEWNSTFQNFRKRRQPRKVYPNFRKFFPGSCPSIQLCSRNFLILRLNGLHFEIQQPDWTLLGEISVPFATESTFSKVLVK